MTATGARKFCQSPGRAVDANAEAGRRDLFKVESDLGLLRQIGVPNGTTVLYLRGLLAP